MTVYAPVYRLVVYQPRSIDPNEAIALQPVGSAPHQDYFKVTTGPAATGPTRPTAAMLSHSGMTVFTAANCVDGNLANTGWGTDSAVSGATLQVDLGAGVARTYQVCRVYVLTGTYAGVYDVEYSDNGSSWSKAVIGFKPTVGDNWHSCTWQDAGAHRYWRLLLTNTPGAGPELSELELWESDGPGEWKPYLFAPTGRRGRIDFLTKRTDVGVMNFRVGNPALAASDPLTRWLAAFSGDLKGKLRLGNLRAAAWESLNGGATFSPFWAGRVRTCEDAGGPAAYDIGIRELGDDMQALAFVGRPHVSVTQAGFATLAPIGVSAAYGRIPAAPPFTGSMFGVLADVHGVVVLDAASVGRPDNLVTKNLLDAVAQPALPAPTSTIQINPPTFTGPARARVKRLDTQASGVFKVGRVGQNWNGSRTHQRAVSFWIAPLDVGSVGYMALPPDSTNVEITVETEHYATDETPILIDGLRWPQLWRLLLEGKFGYLWASPETLPPGRSYGDPRIPIPYHAAKFAALEADERFPPGRWLVRKREPRGMFIERQNRIANLAYYRDGAGAVVPVDLRLPSDVASVPTITDADLIYGKEPPRWAYDRGRAITRVDGVHYTDLQQTVADLQASSDLYPTIQGGGFQELRHPLSILNVGSADLGDVPYALDAIGFRAMPGDEPYKDQARSTYLERRLVDLSTEIARPYASGGTTILLPCARGGNGDAQPGELRKLAVKAILDPGTNKHGGTRLIRVAERAEDGPAIILRAEDLGLSTVAQTPSLGAPAQEAGNTNAGITTAVTLGAGAHPVEVHYAVTPTSVGSAPAEADAAWTPSPGGLVRSNVTLSIRQLPAGKRIWVRGRSFPDAQVDYKLPSAWVAAGGTGRVDLATLAAPSAPAGSLQTAKSFRVSWTAGAADLATEILLATPTTDPRVLIGRALPGSAFFDVPGDVVGLTLIASTTYRVEVRHVAQDGAISAGVTVDIATTGVTTNAPNTGGIAVLIGKP